MSIVVDAKVLAENIKKIMEVTGSEVIHFNFMPDKINMKSAINQYRMEINMPMHCTEQMKFAAFAENLLTILGNKDKVEFTLDGTLLKFKSGRTKGELVTLEYTDYSISDEDGKPLSDTIKNYIFDNLERVNKTASKNAEYDLKILVKDKKIKMLVFSPFFNFLVNDIDTDEDFDFNILLKYANILTQYFTKDDNVKIITTETSVEIHSDNCKIVLPFSVATYQQSIEKLEENLNEYVKPEDIQGRFIMDDPKSVLEDLEELKNFAKSPSTLVKFIKEKDSNKISYNISTQVGKLDKTIEAKSEGSFSTSFNLEELKDSLSRIADHPVKMTFYPNFAILTPSFSKDSIYAVVASD